MLTIHGRNTSSNVQLVMWGLAEMGIGANRLDIGGAFGGNDTSEFLAKNPNGRVPVLEDGDVTMFESQAILRYVASKHSEEALWSTDPIKRAPIDQWMDWAKINVHHSLIYKVFWQLVRTTAADRDHALIAQGVEDLKGLMKIADAQIAKHGWLAGPNMTLADISFGTILYRYFEEEFERADLPNIAAYYEKLKTRPAYAEHVMVSYESLRVEGV